MCTNLFDHPTKYQSKTFNHIIPYLHTWYLPHGSIMDCLVDTNNNGFIYLYNESIFIETAKVPSFQLHAFYLNRIRRRILLTRRHVVSFSKSRKPSPNPISLHVHSHLGEYLQAVKKMYYFKSP